MFLFRDFPLKVDKEIRFSLKNIYGLGLRKTYYISARAGLGYPFYLNKINSYYFEIIHLLLKGLILSDVRIKRRMEFDIAKMINTNHIKGLRHKLSLPIHGQRTRTNASTQRTKRMKRHILLNRD